MDVETATSTAGGGTGDRADLQNKAGLLPDAMEGVETAQEMQVHLAPHPLHQPQSTGGPNLHKDKRVTESLPPEAWRMPLDDDR